MSVFEQEQNQPNGEDQTPLEQDHSTDVLTDQLAAIKNERGEQKYKTPEEALKALAHSQSFIEKLERENQELRPASQKAEELSSKVASLTEQLTSLSAKQDQLAHQPQGLDEAGIASFVQSALQQEKAQTISAENEKRVSDALAKRYGEKVNEKLTEKANALGMTVQGMQQLARTSPEAALALFPEPQASPQPMAGGHRTDVFQNKPETSVKRNANTVFGWGSETSIYDESRNSAQMVEELHSAGMSIDDLSNPKNFAKVFGRI